MKVPPSKHFSKADWQRKLTLGVAGRIEPKLARCQDGPLGCCNENLLHLLMSMSGGFLLTVQTFHGLFYKVIHLEL